MRYRISRRNNIPNSGVDEDYYEDVYQKFVDLTGHIGVTIHKTVCHRLPKRRNGPKGIVIYVMRQTNHLIMGNKRKLKEMSHRLHIIVDFTTLKRKVIHLIRQKKDVASVTTVNEKVLVYLNSSDRFVFNNVFELYE